MAETAAAAPAPVRFDTHPSRYVHWKLEIAPPIARLSMDVEEDRGLRPGYPLKLNSYDLGVDLELADAIQRLRFEHPEVRAVVIASAKDRVFCSGANIYMLGSSSHAFKVNFCKYTNETRLAIEDASQAALNYTDRDFGSPSVNETREFGVPDYGFIIDIDDATAITSVTGIGGAEWRLGTDGPAASFGVYTYIEVGAFRTASVLMGFTRNEDKFGLGFLDPIQVTGTWGWPVVPADVQRAVIWAANVIEGDTSNRQGGLASKSVAEVSENYIQQQSFQSAVDDNEPLPARSRALLYPYRRISL